MSEELPVLALVRDLIFASRIAGAGRGVGREVRIVREGKGLEGAEGAMLVVDLNQEGAIEAAAGWGARTGRPVVGFVSHVDVETTRRAREGGIGRVMARSAFVERLGEVLRGQKGEG